MRSFHRFWALCGIAVGLLAGSADSRASDLGLGLGVFYDSLSSTDPYGATGTVASGVSYRLDPRMRVRLSRKWALLLTAEGEFMRFYAPANVAMNQTSFFTFSGSGAVEGDFGRFQWLLGTGYYQDLLLNLTGPSSMELHSVFLPEAWTRAGVLVIRKSAFQAGLAARFGMLVPGSTPDVTSGLDYGGELRLRFGTRSRVEFSTGYLQESLNTPADRQKTNQLYLNLVLPMSRNTQ